MWSLLVGERGNEMDVDRSIGLTCRDPSRETRPHAGLNVVRHISPPALLLHSCQGGKLSCFFSSDSSAVEMREPREMLLKIPPRNWRLCTAQLSLECLSCLSWEALSGPILVSPVQRQKGTESTIPPPQKTFWLMQATCLNLALP